MLLNEIKPPPTPAIEGKKGYPKIMGILNVNDDSFYNPDSCTNPTSRIPNSEFYISYALQMLSEGADIIDIGAESTRPGAQPVDAETEISRLLPVLKELRRQAPDCTISVDTYKPEVAKMALKEGADIINDIYALKYIPLSSLLTSHSKLILMHAQGTPATMQDNPHYDDVVAEIMAFFAERIDYCLAGGISRDRLILDPGIGFGKTFEHNITILQNLDKFKTFNLPIMIGASRKSFINNIYPSQPPERLIGSLATTVVAYFNQIDIVRVHDVKAHKEMINSLSWMV